MSNQDQTPNEDFIPVNQILNSKPQLGPIPGEQVIPWIAILVISYLICQGILGLGLVATLLVSTWGIGSWWILTGNESWRFLSKFYSTPRWTRGYQRYHSLLQTEVDSHLPKRRNRRRRRR